jgi:hypothetical protein
LYAAVISIEDAKPSTSSLWDKQITLPFLKSSDLPIIGTDLDFGRAFSTEFEDSKKPSPIISFWTRTSPNLRYRINESKNQAK